MGTPLAAAHLRSLIQETLKPLHLWTADVEELLMATCANESNFGEFRTQAPNGPARGIMQCEGEDFRDIWKNYLQYHATLAFQVKNYNGGQEGTVEDLVNNDQYSICLARIQYLRVPEPIPPANDIEQIWKYYKLHYNTPEGSATHDVFMVKYKKYVLEG